MAKYSVPGIRTQEIDNSIQTEAAPGLGIGAIVLKSNKGPVNQRIVTRDYNEFKEIFGAPETLTDYGHFAAENYFANSTQLYAVRATMGDEQYAQIQFTYEDAPVTAQHKSENVAKIEFADNQGINNLYLLAPLSSYGVDGLEGTEWQDAFNTNTSYDNADVSGYALVQGAMYGSFIDILSEGEDRIIFKSTSEDFPGVVANEGYHVIYPETVVVDGDNVTVTKRQSKLMFTTDGWETSALPVVKTKAGGYEEVSVLVPSSATLDGRGDATIKFLAPSGIFNETTPVFYNQIFENGAQNFYPAGAFPTWNDPSANGYGYTPAKRLEVIDWDDPEIKKTYFVDSYTVEGEFAPGYAYGLKYTELNQVDPTYDIAGTENFDEEHTSVVKCANIKEMYDGKIDAEFEDEYGVLKSAENIAIAMLDRFGVSDITDIATYFYINYYSPRENHRIEKLVKENFGDKTVQKNNVEDKLFIRYFEKDGKKLEIRSVFNIKNGEPALIDLPIQQDSIVKYGDVENVVNNIVATPTSYIVNSVDKTYADGYTIKTESDDEPGNGDIEKYQSTFTDQLVIASIGPGEYGNDIGVSIITTACADIPALQGTYGFNWKYKYDDEDQVNANVEGLTWKKVFRINVYIKNKNQTAEAAWGTGMEALLKTPAESWYVSTDPYAKDEEGNSLYAPNVINGHSEYIYVSRASTNDAVDRVGNYAQPVQTFAIYGLTGGKNSTKDNVSEKTAALTLYKDRVRSPFDILFNVEAIDTFNGRQRYNAHQRKIAELAGNRKQDIGVVQVTSKSCKTGKQMVSEAKMFTFNNASYVAEYGGYDKYYNGDVASWIYLPKSVAGACAMAHCDTFVYPWMAPAGVANGTIPYANGQLLRLTDDEIGDLYDNNVNTTRDCGNYGVVLWGQKTALKKNSLLNRINVRRCMNYIEKILEHMMTPYLFQQNNVNTRSSARNDIDAFLQRVKAAGGIDRYDVSVTQDDEDPTIMNVNIIVYPTSAIEFIDIKIYINRTKGVSMDETTGRG